jgi:dimethylargininase
VIGLSERTNRNGAEQLGNILGQFGYVTDIVDVPEALHFKSSVNFIDENSLLVTQASYWLDCLSAYRKFVVPQGEEYAANVVWINDHILIPADFPGTRRLLEEQAYQVIEMPVSEIAKMDGGLTCLSLRLT